MVFRSDWFGPTLRAAEDDGSRLLVVRYAWPFGRRNSRSYRDEYLPAVTLNGEPVPAEWGTSIYVLNEPSYDLRAVQGSGATGQDEIAGPLSAVATGTVEAGEPVQLVYAPSGPTGQGRGNANPPRLLPGRRWRKDVTSPLMTVYAWLFAFVLLLGPPLAALLSKL